MPRNILFTAMIADGLDKSRFVLENCCLDVIIVAKKPVESGGGFISVCQRTSCLSFYDLVVKVESNDWKKKTLFEFHHFTSPTGDGTAVLRDHPRATRRASRLQGKGGTFFSQLFWDPEYCCGLGSRSRDLPLCSQALYDWANPAADKFHFAHESFRCMFTNLPISTLTILASSISFLAVLLGLL